MEIFFGGPVSAGQRFSRPDIEGRILQYIQNGAGAKLFGLRRTGKSSVLLFALETMPEQGFGVINIDAQGMRSLDRLLFGVFNALPREHKGLADRMLTFVGQDGAISELVREAIKGVMHGTMKSEAAAAITDYWPAISAHIVRVLDEVKPRLLLCIDELPFMLQNMIQDNPVDGPRQVDQLLAALRSWRQAGLKMLLAGSIGIAGLARKHGFKDEHLNDLSPVLLPELTMEQTRDFIQEALQELPKPAWTEEHTKILLEEIGAFYPSFLAKSLLELSYKAPPPATDIPEVFATRIRPVFHQSFLQQFDRRFKFYKSIEGNVLRALILPILRAVLTRQDGCAQSEICQGEDFDVIEVREVLAMLVEDGFLDYTEDRDGHLTWRPASRLVSLWWRKTGL